MTPAACLSDRKSPDAVLSLRPSHHPRHLPRVMAGKGGTRRGFASLCCALALTLFLVFGGAKARADTAADPYAGLASQSFDSIVSAVQAVALSGDARAHQVLDALGNNALYTWRYDRPDHALFIHDPQTGKWLNARTGDPVHAPPFMQVRRIVANDMVKNALQTATGVLDLSSPDPALRKAAASAIFANPAAATLPGVRHALSIEKNPAARAALLQAEAADILSTPSASSDERLAAIHAVAARDDMPARNLLSSLQGEHGPVATAAAAAIAHIDFTLRLWSWLETVYYGLSLGSVLLLAAAGLAITFGVMGVINMAHGEMVMIGAYVTFSVQQVFRAYIPDMFGSSLIVAIPAAFLVAGAIGILIERCMIRFLYGRPLETLLATWGLSLILQQAIRSIFGAENQNVGTPDWMSGYFALGGLTITLNRLAIIVFTIIVLAALMAVMRYTPLGLRMRAVTQNRRMAASMGIRTPWIDAMTFGLGSGIAGIAGVALSQIDNVSPNLGQNYIIDSFMVVVFGGVGNLWGTTLAALVLGIVNKALEPVAGAVLGKIVVLVLIILFIQRRPRGLFPVKGRAVEA
jgi:urea transport system permease protein|nr:MULTISPECIES: urea ABC transporter permease subunit UrtB [unclassified Acidisoma]